MEHLVDLATWSDEQINDVLAKAKAFAAAPQDARDHNDRILVSAFYEASTRTRLSFEAAAHRLGARVIGFSEAGTTSAAKGESLEDAMRVVSAFGDAVVLRHPEAGAAAKAAGVASCPVINAGDGAGLHPTQTLVDLYTLTSNLGDLGGKTVAVVGDLRYGRTVHSLVPALRRHGATVVACPAPGLGLPASFDVDEVTLDDAAAADALYLTRVQKERMEGRAANAPRVDAAWLKKTKSKAILLHPLPRVDELAADVDVLPAAKYFEQARNGVPVRMAILDALWSS